MIRQILEGLNQNEIDLLMYAFEQGVEGIVEFEDDTIIAVNFGGKNYDIIEQQGCWTIARLRESDNV